MVEQFHQTATFSTKKISFFPDAFGIPGTNIFKLPTIYKQAGSPRFGEKSKKEFAPGQIELGTKSITDYYSVENEIEYLLKYANSLTPEQKKTYLKENIEGLLAEFAGKVPFRRKTYIMRGDDLSYGNLRMIDMLAKTTELAGADSREGEENRGLINLFKTFESSIANFGAPPEEGGLIISPPKFWNYGFVFHYEPTYDQSSKTWFVRLNILWYPENQNEITRSKQILHNISPSYHFNSTKEFLENPIFDLKNVPNLPSVMRAVGISQSDITKSQQFEVAAKTDPYISAGIHEYATRLLHICSTLQKSGKLDINDPVLKQEIEVLNSLIVGIYTYAYKMKDKFQQKIEREIPHDFNSLSVIQPQHDLNHSGMLNILYQHSRNSVRVVGGGSCPSVKKSTQNITLSPSDVVESLISGRSLEGLTTESLLGGFGGGEKSGSYHCPRCNKEYANETDVPPESRTKICDGTLPPDGKEKCDFRFNC